VYSKTGTVTASYADSVYSAGQIEKDISENVRLNVNLECEVRSIDANGLPSATHCVVRSLSGSENDETIAPMTAGESFDIHESSNGTVVTGIPLSEGRALPLAIDAAVGRINPASPGHIGWDFHRGASPGESWPTDPAEIRSALSDGALSVKGADISGTTRYVDQRFVGDTKCAYLYSEIVITGVTVPGLPAGVQVNQSDMFLALAVDLPLDAMGHLVASEITASHSIDSSKNGLHAGRSMSLKGKFSYDYLEGDGPE
jgi:hypothetical protein